MRDGQANITPDSIEKLQSPQVTTERELSSQLTSPQAAHAHDDPWDKQSAEWIARLKSHQGYARCRREQKSKEEPQSGKKQKKKRGPL